MKKLLQGIVLTCAALTTPLMAQTVTYACQYVESGGFYWEDGDWELTKLFLGEPFFLTAQDGSLMPVRLDPSREYDDSFLKRTFLNPLYESTCKLPKSANLGEEAGNTIQSCADDQGNSLIFNFDRLTGAAANLLGSVISNSDGNRDTISVHTFTCQVIQ